MTVSIALLDELERRLIDLQSAIEDVRNDGSACPHGDYHNVGFCITKTVDNLPVGFNAVKNTVKYDPSWDISPHELLSNSEIKIRQEKIV